MRCLIVGSGRPLVLCHGFLSSAEEFGGRFSALAAHRRLIIPDLPGNGDSTTLRTPHTAAALAAAVEGLLDHLGIDEFDVAGLCLGASVACALTARCGDRVGHLVLHTPLVDPSLLRPRFRAQIRVLTVPLLWRAVVALSRNRTVSDLYKRYVVSEGAVDASVADVNFDNQCRADPNAAREWLRDSAQRHDLEMLLSRHVSTLVIVAGRDQVVDVDRLQELIAPHPHIRLYVDDEQGHGWNRAAVQRQTSVLLAFFNTEDAVPAAAVG